MTNESAIVFVKMVVVRWIEHKHMVRLISQLAV